MIVRVHPAAPPWTFSTEPPPAVSFGGGLVHCKIQCFCTWKFDESRNLASAVADRSQSSLKSWQCHSVRHLGLLGFVLWGSRNYCPARYLDVHRLPAEIPYIRHSAMHVLAVLHLQIGVLLPLQRTF